MRKSISLMLFTLFTAMPLVGQAATVNVDNAAGAGCSDVAGTPYCTIAAAVAAATAGDTIEVAVGIYEETLVIDKDLTLEGDTALTTIIDGAGGGAPVIKVGAGVTTTIRAFTLRNGNEPTLGGGGLQNFLGTVLLEDMLITDNTAGGAGGGGILNLQGSMTILRSVISNNHTTSSTGGIYTTTGFTDIRDSAIIGNTAVSFGGGVYASGVSTLRIVNSTISGNETNSHGGGVLLSIAEGGFAGIYNTTISRNIGDADANNTGGDPGLSVSEDTLPPVLANTILAGNFIQDDEGPIPDDCFGTIDSRGYNIIQTSADCTGYAESDLLDVDPLLDDLTSASGTTFVHALLTDSPAVDGGDPDGCTYDDQDAEGNPIITELTTDQRGELRPIDGDADGTDTCDIGAYEVQSVCGDGLAHGDEACDDGNDIEDDYCNSACEVIGACGDNDIQSNEVCDDGNAEGGDTCFADCQTIDLDADGSGSTVDCVDTDAKNFPGNTEVCDGQDNDCDEPALTDENLGSTTCGIGECQVTTLNCIAGEPQTCTSKLPSAEICDGKDNDCDTLVDDLGDTTCGVGACEVTVPNCADGATQTCEPGTPNDEICDGLDNDCDAATDEDLGSTTCGVGACEVTVSNCADGATQTCTPGTPVDEICDDTIDNDCDGTADEVDACPVDSGGDADSSDTTDDTATDDTTTNDATSTDDTTPAATPDTAEEAGDITATDESDSTVTGSSSDADTNADAATENDTSGSASSGGGCSLILPMD